jgi:hypothetical protein
MISQRSRSGLAGSVLALSLARIPIESAMYTLRDQFLPLGVRVRASVVLCASTWVDNIYLAGTRASGATAAAEFIAAFLRDEWLSHKSGQ